MLRILIFFIVLLGIGYYMDSFKTVLLWEILLGAILFFGAGSVSVFECCQKNHDLSRIREKGTRLTAKVVSCEPNAKYSTATVPAYSYYVDFVIEGKEKRGATLSRIWSPEGSDIEIYYLPFNEGTLGGVAIAEESGNPGTARLFYGIIEFAVAVILFFAWRKLKSPGEKRVNGGERESTGQIGWRRRRRMVMGIGALVFFLAGMLFLVSGVLKNREVIQIKENGVKTTATVKRYKSTEHWGRGETFQKEYFVEFFVEGQKKRGRFISTENLLRNDTVDIYYLPGGEQEVFDVALADNEDKPGRNYIYRSVFLLLFALGFFLDFLND
ncbi:MAG: hypothetical protein NC300_00735 [Bacteroidales bacterium]|nr:hypothetical protein [Clostridium sp.]MCM1202650.1 hypothetical protein [Bacteroidales bacterium]